MKVRNLETPALVIDRQEMEKNLQRMNGLLEGTCLKLRPHYKTHKSPVIARMQLENGACGITCSKLSEAEDLANAGIEDILIANQVVQPSKISRLAHLAGRCRLTVCVDQEENIRALSAAAVLAGTQIHCYVELDIGMFTVWRHCWKNCPASATTGCRLMQGIWPMNMRKKNGRQPRQPMKSG